MLRVNHEQVANDTGCGAMQAMDPFAAVRAKNKAQGLQVNNPLEVEKAKNEQQAKARQMVLQQQAISTAAAASKTQREVYIGNLQQVCCRLCSCVPSMWPPCSRFRIVLLESTSSVADTRGLPSTHLWLLYAVLCFMTLPRFFATHKR